MLKDAFIDVFTCTYMHVCVLYVYVYVVEKYYLYLSSSASLSSDFSSPAEIITRLENLINLNKSLKRREKDIKEEIERVRGEELEFKRKINAKILVRYV